MRSIRAPLVLMRGYGVTRRRWNSTPTPSTSGMPRSCPLSPTRVRYQLMHAVRCQLLTQRAVVQNKRKHREIAQMAERQVGSALDLACSWIRGVHTLSDFALRFLLCDLSA